MGPRTMGARPLAGALMLAPALAWSHPHGSIECSAEVRLQHGRLAQVRGTLWLDEAHSGEALAAIRGATGTEPDPALLSRFAFGLKRQFGRLNWLFSVQADGQPLALEAAEPELTFERGRLRITVAFDPDGSAAPARGWSLACADPSYYWVTSFGPPSLMPSAQDRRTGNVQVHGCREVPLAAPAQEARAGMARHDWRCD